MISVGKSWSLRRMADNHGLFKMASLDQRPPIEDPIAKCLGPDDNLATEVVKFKRLLIESFQDKSSAMLLDPSFAVAGCLDALDAKKSLLVSLEDPYSPKTSAGGVFYAQPFLPLEIKTKNKKSKILINTHNKLVKY